MAEIKSSLVNSEEMKFVKESLLHASEEDNKENFRVKVLEYINDSSYNNADMFFYDELEYIRFLKTSEGGDSIAFTTPDGLIYLNCPDAENGPGEKVRVWDFIYCHECLHQLWDTFGVAEKIKAENLEYNHMLLNIASDCVINDYLYHYRKKERFENGIFPDVLEKEYGVIYDRKKDTQFTLYVKLLEMKQSNKEAYDKMSNDTRFNGKLTPDHVEEAPSGSGPTQQPEKHSDDYIKGYTQGIQDALDEKVDPKTFKPKKPKNDYDQGYNDVMAEMKEGMEKGIQMSKDNDGGNNPGSDLPQIPWDTPPQSNQGGQGDSDNNQDNSDIDDMSADEAAKDAQKSANDAQKAADDAKSKANQSGSDSDKDAAGKAQDAADKAKDAAKSAADAAKKGDKQGAQDAAKEARKEANNAKSEAGQSNSKEGEGGGKADNAIDKMSGSGAAASAEKSAERAKKAADEAKKAAEEAGKKSNSAEGKENAKHAKEAAENAKDAAERAAKAAKEASDAAKKGNTEAAREAAKVANNQANIAEDNANNAKNARDGKKETAQQQQNNPTPGKMTKATGEGGGVIAPMVESPADLAEIRKKTQALRDEYRKKLSGDLGKFIEKCEASKQLKKEGIQVDVIKGNTGWDSKMTSTINTFVKNKVFQKKRKFMPTYSRIKRGSGFVQFGQPILPGKKVKEDKMNIDLAFYVDKSGSMYNCIDQVFEAAYSISDILTKHFGKDPVVDKTEFRMFAFDESMHELKWGKKCGASNGNMSFEEMCEFMEKTTKDYLVNVFITDAQFQITASAVEKILKDHQGCILFITNVPNKTMEALSKKMPKQLFYIEADENFTLDKNKK